MTGNEPITCHREERSDVAIHCPFLIGSPRSANVLRKDNQVRFLETHEERGPPRADLQNAFAGGLS
jgi:hypothetical protein